MVGHANIQCAERVDFLAADTLCLIKRMLLPVTFFFIVLSVRQCTRHQEALAFVSEGSSVEAEKSLML